MWHTLRLYQGRIQDFKLGGVNIKKLRRAEGSAKILGYYVWKITILHQFFFFFSNFKGGGGASRVRPLDPPLYTLVVLSRHDLVSDMHSDYTLMVLSQHDLVSGIQSDYTLMVLSRHDRQWHTLWLYLDGLITARFGQCGIHSDYTLMVLSQHDLVSVAYTLIIPWWSYHSTISKCSTLLLYRYIAFCADHNAVWYIWQTYYPETNLRWTFLKNFSAHAYR
jgi:hypothetical protein